MRPATFFAIALIGLKESLSDERQNESGRIDRHKVKLS